MEEKTEEIVHKTEEQQIKEIQEKMAKGVKFVCSQHGDVTNDVIALSYRTYDNEAKSWKRIKHLYCSVCLDNYLQSLVKNSLLGDVRVGVDKATLEDLGIDLDKLQNSEKEEK